MYIIIFYNGTIDKISISSSSTISNNTSSSSMLSTSSFMWDDVFINTRDVVYSCMPRLSFFLPLLFK